MSAKLRLRPRKKSGPALLLLALPSTLSCADLREPGPSEDPTKALPVTQLPRSQVRLDWTLPAAGQALAPGDPVLLCFSGILAPSSIRPGVVSLSSGNRNYDSDLSFDLVDWRELQGRPRCSGSLLRVLPPEPLAARTRYRLRLVDRLRDWQGRALQSQGDPRWIERDENRVLVVEFLTGEASEPQKPGPQETPPYRFASLFAPKAVFSRDSPSCACHYQDGSFDLRDPQALYQQLRFGQQASGEPWITPGHPSTSYLIFKLLRTPEGHALAGISGAPMPPSAPIKPQELAQIARWIEDGALP